MKTHYYSPCHCPKKKIRLEKTIGHCCHAPVVKEERTLLYFIDVSKARF